MSVFDFSPRVLELERAALARCAVAFTRIEGAQRPIPGGCWRLFTATG